MRRPLSDRGLPRARGRFLPAALVAAAAAVIFLGGGEAWGGALPLVDWGAPGGVDWSSGYVIAYGIGSGPANIANPNIRRAAGQKAAYIAATRNLLRACLDLPIRDGISVRDYLRADTELQEELRERISSLIPWSVKLEDGHIVRVAVRIPIGGEGGLSQVLGPVEEWSLDNPVEVRPYFPGTRGGTEEKVTGIVLLASRQLLSPSVRPQLMGEDGRLLATYETAATVARSRPAFIAFYESLNQALRDPVVSPDPVVVAADQSRGPGNDLVLPRFLQEDLLHTAVGRKILEEVRVVVVLQ